MTTRELAGKSVAVTDDGYLTDPSVWTREMAIPIAQEEGIADLTAQHWKVIEFLRKDFQETGKLPTIRRVDKTGGVPVKDLYTLFPGGPLKKAARIAGLPKPASCV